jgi:hypothetical protein
MKDSHRVFLLASQLAPTLLGITPALIHYLEAIW